MHEETGMTYQRDPDEIRRERDYLDRDYGSGGILPAAVVFVFALMIGYILFTWSPVTHAPQTTSERIERPLPPPTANPTPDTTTPKR
jgi:hypothetical protein